MASMPECQIEQDIQGGRVSLRAELKFVCFGNGAWNAPYPAKQ